MFSEARRAGKLEIRACAVAVVVDPTCCAGLQESKDCRIGRADQLRLARWLFNGFWGEEVDSGCRG
ncbi:uncharacterized protein RSE6_07177 [Rhynchosporium secalis]|uniref:Uncharacterized protein n=1 Tax=Rhynchosporium secalis TaxID=38038 RepID=A0A1E1MC88_RHYSE|nr:uncharacterized protein RSE6_07177 [Rhynchosporium secalis]